MSLTSGRMIDMLEKIHIFISILAALVVTAIGIAQFTPLPIVVNRLIFFIIFFYFIGLFVRIYLHKKVFMDKDLDSVTEEGASPEDADAVEAMAVPDETEENGEQTDTKEAEVSETGENQQPYSPQKEPSEREDAYDQER